jgi:cell division protein ZapA (FtsZ GTPase activity inhibitor)
MSKEEAITSTSLEVTLLSRSYRIPCCPDDVPLLQEVVQLIEGKASVLKEHTKGDGEKLAFMVALNVVHEFMLERRAQEAEMEQIRWHIAALRDRLRTLLAAE